MHSLTLFIEVFIMSDFTFPTIQITCVDTNLVVPVETKLAKGKLEDVFYRIELVRDFPTLSIGISLGTQSTQTPEKGKPGYKVKGTKYVDYSPLIVYSFDKQMQPSIDKFDLLDQSPSVDGSTVYIYTNDNKKEARDYPNHLDLINSHILPMAVRLLFNPKYIGARFSSWLYVGLKLITLITERIDKTEDNGFIKTLQPITQEALFEAVTSAQSELHSAKAYVTETHTKIAESIRSKQKQLPNVPATVTVEAEVKPVISTETK
jgi:hypothetical protein